MNNVASIFEQLRRDGRRPAPRDVLSAERESRLVQFYRERLLKWGYDERNAELSKLLAHLLARLYAGAAVKGVLLQGVPGSGKTVALRLVCEYFGSRWWDAEAIYDLGSAAKGTVGLCGPGHQHPFCRPTDACVDEMGGEETIAEYGATREPVGQFLAARYRLFVECGFLTHVTTNLDEQAIVRRYGERLVSRLHEMCAWIDCGKKDWRVVPKAVGQP